MHKHQKTILEAISVNPNITTRQLGQLLGTKGQGQVQHHLAMLVKGGFIEKGTKWIIKGRENESAT